ncbi:hypothetical protein [Runella sp.]|uniref:hypothetical protein n=1 Tax=Runella sp. TaxID=1960881 RepID=UPI003D0AA580
MNNYFLLSLLFLALATFGILSNYILISDTLYFNTFAEQLTYEQIEAVITQTKEWQWVGYALIPLIVLIKLTLITACLSLGVYFFTNHFSFKAAFRVALEAEFVFLIPVFLKIVWFAVFQTDYTLQDLQSFYPLSALNFFDSTQVQPWLIYPLQLFNVFEIIYWVLLAKGISQLIEHDMGKSMEVVMASYGTGLLLWVAVVMFITVSYSP